MINIIVLSNNELDKLKRTLISICLQDIKNKCNVSIIGDSNYDNIVKLFNDKLNISVINQNEIDYVNNIKDKYIIYINSGDVFYNVFSILNLYNAIENNEADLICGMVQEKKDNKITVSNGNLDLYGKIFKRSYFNNNYINNTIKINKDAKVHYIERIIIAK